jgi:hypothetical protein
VLHTGADIPGVWVADNPAIINVAGLLRAGAETLQFSIDRGGSQSSSTTERAWTSAATRPAD